MKKSLKYAIINGIIAGGLVFLGAFTDGYITVIGIIAAFSAAGIIFLTKLRDYYGKIENKKAIKGKIFEFI